MPTNLPPRAAAKKLTPADIVLNTLMVVSGLALAFVVLRAEANYAFRPPEPPAQNAQMVRPEPVNLGPGNLLGP